MVPLFYRGIFIMKRKHVKTSKRNIKWELLPILFVICILPFVLRMEIITTGLENLTFLPASMAKRADFFLYWKGRLLIISAVIMLLVLLDYFLMRRGRDRGWKTWLPLIGYEVCAFLSAFTSDYPMYAMQGIMEHFESLWVLLGYGIVAYYTYLFIETKEDVYLIVGGLLISSFFQCVLGLFQIAGKDILNSAFFKELMIPGEYAQFREQVVFNFSEEIYQRVSTTLYNTNYAGVYFCMILPIALGAIIFAKGRKKIFVVILSVALFLCLIGTGSKSALLTIFIVLLIGSIMLAIKDRKRWYRGLIAVVVMLFLWFGYDKLTGIETGKRITESMTRSAATYKLQDIQLQEDTVEVMFDGKMISIGWEKTGEALYLDVRDETGAKMELRDTKKKRRVKFADPHFKGLRLWCYRKDGIPYLCMKYDGQEWKFTDATEDGTMCYINIWGKADRIEKAESVLFDGKETWFTYRGYIWGRTIPLLKKYIIWGSGPDTFLHVFPQNDYVMRANMGFGFFSEILSKPHCMYLQMAVQTGVVSVLLFLIFLGITIADFVNWMCRNKTMLPENYLMIGVFLAICCYLILGIFNDSMIVTAPIFFVLVGMWKKMCQIDL